MRTILSVVLSLLIAPSLFAASSSTPIKNGVLQSDLNMNGFGATNGQIVKQITSQDGSVFLTPSSGNGVVDLSAMKTGPGALLYDPVVQTIPQATATNLFPFWSGKNTNSNWKFYNPDGYTPSTTNWTRPLDFSGLAAGALNAAAQSKTTPDDIALITPFNGITALHYWGGSVGMPVIFNNLDGTRFTNYVASFTNPIPSADILVVTFSNAAPAGVNPFWLLPTNATSFVPTDFIGDQVIWLRNNPTTAGGAHMNHQAVGIGPPLVSATGVADPASPFWEGPGTSGDSGGPVFTVLQGGGTLRPVYLFSLYAAWTAGYWVSWPSYWSAIQPLLGTNQAHFVDLSQYQTVAPNIPPNGVTNVHAAQLPLASSVSTNDSVIIELFPFSGQPVTERISAYNLLSSLSGFPNWPPSSGGGGGGTNGIDIRPLTNSFTGPNAFKNNVALSNGVFDVYDRMNTYGTNFHTGPEYFTGGQTFSGGQTIFGSDSSLGEPGIWFEGVGVGALIATPGPGGLPLSIYAGSNMANITIGGNQPANPVLIQDNNIFAGGFGISNLNLTLATNQSLKIGLNATNNDILSGINLTNGLGSVLSNYVASVSANATNEALRQATAITNGGITQVSNYVLTISQNATNEALLIGLNATNNAIPRASGFGTNTTILIDQNGYHVVAQTNGGVNLLTVSNSVVTANTNTVINALLTVNSSTNTDWVSNQVVTGWQLIKGTETNSSITGPGVIGIDGNGARSAVTIGSGLSLSGGALTATGGASTGPYVTNLNGFGTNITLYGTTTFGTNAGAGMLTIDGLGNMTLYSTNGYLFQAKDTGSNTFFSLHGTNQQINVRGLIQFPTNGVAIGGTTDPGAGNLNASNTVSALGITNRQFAAIGVVTNDANGKTYTTPTLPFTLTAGTSANLAGALTDETGAGLAVFSGSPTETNSTIKGDVNGTNAFYIDVTGVTISNNINYTKLTNGAIYTTGTASAANVTNRSFAAIGVVTNDASGKEYTTPTIPSSLVGSGLAVYGGSSGPITVPINGSYFMPPNNSFTNNVTDDAGERAVIPANGTLANLYVICSANPGAVANSLTIFTNGVSTGITVAMNNVTSGNDTTHTAPVLAGYAVNVKLITAASGTAVKWTWGFQLK